MRIIVKLSCEENIKLPLSYNYYLQSLIYRLISDKDYAEFIHDTGFVYDNRKFRMFSFSRIEGDFVLDKKTKILNFKNNIQFTISSPDENFIKFVAETLLFTKKVKLVSNILDIDSVEFDDNKIHSKAIKVYTKTPIVVSTTLASGQTVFYSPLDNCFSNRIKSNVLKKYNSFNGTSLENIEFDIRIISKNSKKKVVMYKNTVINGYMCELELFGNPEILDFVYATSLGEKNSQGFGLLGLKK